MRPAIQDAIYSTSALALLAAAMSPTPALAQASGEVADDNNEIVVSARKQDEKLQDVPVTITSLAGEDLEKYQVSHIADITSRVPTLNVQVGASGSGGQLSLRGVGSSNISAAFDSAVAFDFDGVTVSSMRILQAGFVDPAQIDVLKGPQSLYFGKSASAGVIAVRSAEPTRDWELSLKGSYEFEEDGYTVDGYLSGPLSDTLGVRLAFMYNDIDKYVKLQPNTPARNRNRGMTTLATRLTLNWEPLDNFKANLKANYVRYTNDGANGAVDVYCGANGIADPIQTLFATVASGNNCNLKDDLYFLPDAAAAISARAPSQQRRADRWNANPGVPFGITNIWFNRLKMDLDLSDALTLTSVSGYFDMSAQDVDTYGYGGIGPATAGAAGLGDALTTNNPTGAPFGLGTGFTDHQLKQFTQELRLASNNDGVFNFMLGAFYEYRDIEFNTSQQALNSSLLFADPATGFTFDWHKRHRTKAEAVSVFASTTLDFTEQLQLSGGLRWTKENKTNRIAVPYVHAFAAGIFGPGGYVSPPIRFEDDNLSPEITLRYKVNPDVNLFASYKTGFKSGGIDNSALPSNTLANLASNPNAARDLIFGSETAKGGEIGMKAQFANRAFTFNPTLFYYKFKDLQLQVFKAEALQFVTTNAGEVKTKGLDLNWAWQTPMEGLRLSGALAYTDSKFTKPFVALPPGGDDLNGRSTAHAPKLAGNFAADLTVPIGNDLEFGLSGNLNFSGSYFATETDLSDYKQESYASVDGTISIAQADGKWRLALVGVNLTNKKWVDLAVDRPFRTAPFDDVYVAQSRGRQLFVEARINF